MASYNIRMSLRVTLCSFRLQELIDVIGSKNAVVLKAATSHLAEVYKNEKDESKFQSANAWLRTVINEGVSLRRDRKTPSVGKKGNLLVLHMEVGTHIAVIHSIVRVLGGKELVFDEWSQGISGAILSELSGCGFSDSRRGQKGQLEFLLTLRKLDCGTPLFGDGFHTGWEFYSIIENKEIAVLVAGFREALRFKRELPDWLPKDRKKQLKTRVSDDCRKFLGKSVKWLAQIQKAGQDAYILWS